MCLKVTLIITINIANRTTKFSGICSYILINPHQPWDSFFKAIVFSLMFFKMIIASRAVIKFIAKPTKVAFAFIRVTSVVEFCRRESTGIRF